MAGIPVNPDFRDLLRALSDASARPLVGSATYGGASFPVIGIDALMRNKQALGRPKHLVDLDLLRRHRRR